MIKTWAETGKTVTLKELVPFQGNLKKRSAADICELAQSLLIEGMIMPFVVWNHDEKLYLLDGHGRREALVQIIAAGQHTDLWEQQWPVLVIEAPDQETAQKQLLQISSMYGKINKGEMVKFVQPLGDYTPPVVRINTPKAKTTVPKVKESDSTIVKLSVKKDKVNQLIEILKQTEGVTVL
jgi:hypothetical protein